MLRSLALHCAHVVRAAFALCFKSAFDMKLFAMEINLQQAINDVTRATRFTRTTIDLAFIDMKHCTSSRTMNYNISDHQPIYIIKKIIETLC